MKAFDVCLVFFSPVINDARTLNIARTLVKHGKSVCVLALGDENIRKQLVSEGITFIPLHIPSKGRFINKWWRFGKEILPKIKIVHTSVLWASDGYVLPFVVLWATVRRVRCVYDSREVYSALGMLATRPAVQRVISFVERCCMPFVNEVYTSGQLDSEYLQARFHLASTPRVVMNLPPYTPHHNVRSNAIREKYLISTTSTVLLYQGMIFSGRGLLSVIAALPYLPDTIFVLFGEGDFAEEVRKMALEYGVHDSIIFAGKVPYDELLQWTNSADVGISLIEPISLSYTFALPNKLFEYCMAGIPTIVSNLPAMKKFVEQYGIGVVAPLDASPEELADIIRNVSSPNTMAIFHKKCVEASRILCWEAQEDVIMTIART